MEASTHRAIHIVYTIPTWSSFQLTGQSYFPLLVHIVSATCQVTPLIDTVSSTIISVSKVTGQEGNQAPARDFSDNIPPSLDRRINYAPFQEDLSLWVNVTGLAAHKQGAALVESLSRESKASAKSLPVDTIFAEVGVQRVLKRLEK